MASFSSHVRRESVGMPMTSGGESNTKGTAYETELVALQLIRLLLGKVDSVTWHHGQAGDGIDLVVYEDGIEWGIQAKSGTSKETWTLPRLMEKGVPAYAQLWLKGASNRRFRFQAAVTAPILKKLTITANTMSENEWWKSIDEGSLHPWIKAFAGVMDRSSGHALFKRIDVGFAQIEDLEVDARKWVALFPEPGKLKSALLTCIWSFRNRTWIAHNLREELTKHGITTALEAWDNGWAERLRQSSRSFNDTVSRQRGSLPALARSATLDVIKSIEVLNVTGGVVAVHGPGGAGKSEVLAALLDTLPARRGILALSIVDLNPAQPFLALGLGDRPLCALVRYSQEQSDRPIFVLDQLDQAVWASPALMRIVGDLLRQARDLRIITVIGCRSVDLRDPRIMGWIAGRNTEGNPFDGPERAVSVADLSTNEVKETLAKLHISPDDLDPGILELIRRPLRLRLVVNLAKKGQIHRLRGVRHLVGLMHAWETWVHDDLRRQGQDAQGMSALDQCAEFCQREYATSVPIDALSPDEAQSIQALVELGILIWDDTSKRRLRWSHQNLLDHHLANRWLRSADSGQSIQDLVGPRADQDQRTANRLRLLVPGLCDRTRLRDDITRLSNDNSLRPLSRLGLFRGLAALDESADCLRMRPMVISLLNNPTTWQMALVQICWSRPLWFATLEDWFKVVWQDSTKRNAAISALVSVKTTWGDGVARIITTWREIDPEAITNISFLLYDGHKVDSVLLFSHWLDALDKAPEVHGTHIAWPEFIASHPIRAAQALATLLQKPLRNEWQDPEYFHGLLGPVPAFSEKGREALDHLWIPWSGVSLGQRPSGTIRNSNGPWWSRIIDLIAGAVARALEERQIAWSELVARFPETLRWQDRTLLLRAAKLSHFNDQIQANAAMDWFIRSPAAWFHPANDQPPWMDSAPFISHLASYAAPDKLKILQNTLRQTLDPRFPEDDQRHGATAWFLLNAIPLEQRDQATIDYLAGIESRFANTDQVAYQASWGGVGGIVGSDLSPEQVKVFTDNEWRSAFHNARDNPEIFARQTGHNRVSRRSLDTYAAELRQQSSSNPKRFLSLMESITASDPPAMTEAMICGMLNPPNSTAEDLRLTGAEIISVTTRPLALSQADCSLYIVNCVYQNPSLAWPEELIAALCAWASTPLVPAPNGGHQTEEKLAMSREDLPMATIRALGALAHHNEPLRHRIWARIREAANEHRPDLLASCVVAAYSCRNIDTDAVDGSILDWSSNPLVAAQEDVAELLRWLAQHRQEATSRLLAMSSSEFDWVLGKSGRYRVLLRMDGRITEIDSEFDPARCTLPVKGAMAEVIVAIFRGSPQGWEIATDTWPDWILELTLKLANDSDDNIARQLASVFYVSDGSVWDSRQAVTRLMRDPEFVTRMAKTRSIAIDQHPILGACLIAESLLPWATIIKTIVDQAVSSPMNMHRSGKEVMTVIGRLAEEADQVGDLVNRRLALDAWDALIEAGWSEATDRLASEW